MHGPFEYFHGVLLEFNSDVTEYAKETFIERSVGDDYEIEFVNLLPSHNYQLKMISVTSEINSTIASLHFRAPAASKLKILLYTFLLISLLHFFNGSAPIHTH